MMYWPSNIMANWILKVLMTHKAEEEEIFSMIAWCCDFAQNLQVMHHPYVASGSTMINPGDQGRGYLRKQLLISL